MYEDKARLLEQLFFVAMLVWIPVGLNSNSMNVALTYNVLFFFVPVKAQQFRENPDTFRIILLLLLHLIN